MCQSPNNDPPNNKGSYAYETQNLFFEGGKKTAVMCWHKSPPSPPLS